MCWWAADKLGISWMILGAWYGSRVLWWACLCVYLSVNIFPVLHFKLHLILLACYLWPWLVPFIVVLRYVMYFRFLRRTSCLHIMAMNRLREKGVYSQAAAQIWHCSIYSDWPTRAEPDLGRIWYLWLPCCYCCLSASAFITVPSSHLTAISLARCSHFRSPSWS